MNDKGHKESKGLIMKKYPYTFEEFKEMTEKEFIKKYHKNNKQEGIKILKDKEMQEVIRNAYNGNKYSYEHGLIDEVVTLEYEVQGTTYCLFMLE